MGVPLTRFEDPIRTALQTYQKLSEDSLKFDGDEASKLVPTPDKPNSARSESNVVYVGEPVGKLYVIAFKPGDGSGSEVDYKLDDLEIDPPYPRKSLVVPRNKTGIYSEGHLTVVRHGTEDVHAEPQLFAGTYDLLGLDGNKVKKIGELGHQETQREFSPAITFTVGYRPDNIHERFGDPHAVYSGIPDFIQVCAFLAVSDQLKWRYSHFLHALNPQLPSGLK